MIRLLFPAMAHIAASSILAAAEIVVNHLLHFPIYTGDRFIRVNGWISSVILPVVGIYAFVFLMLGKIQDTELGLVVKHVKILIFNVVMDKFSLNLLLAVSIGAEVSVWA
jgi:hypothetical protein